MLLCGIDEVRSGMTVAASVFHPRRPDVELLRPGVILDDALLERLRALRISRIWIEHDVTRDLDERIVTEPSPTLINAYHQLRHDFAAMAQATVSTAQVQSYRQHVMEMLCEVIANRSIATLTERLIGGGTTFFTHGANVAYLSLIVGLELETYIVRQRARLGVEHARDLTSLGIGALMHDIGKLALSPELRELNEYRLAKGETIEPELLAQYQSHTDGGFEMLANTRMPASARQIVLNHHQHWDGSGFPDMTKRSHGRHKGPQSGEQIHVFSRIVAAVSLLDHLMREAEEQQRPIVAALHAFRHGPWSEWFDPVVFRAVLRKVPPFAVGTHVILSDGRQAVVVAPNLEDPCRPTVRLLSETGNEDDLSLASINLGSRPELSIVRAAGHDVTRHIFTPPAPIPTAAA